MLHDFIQMMFRVDSFYSVLTLLEICSTKSNRKDVLLLRE